MRVDQDVENEIRRRPNRKICSMSIRTKFSKPRGSGRSDKSSRDTDAGDSETPIQFKSAQARARRSERQDAAVSQLRAAARVYIWRILTARPERRDPGILDSAQFGESMDLRLRNAVPIHSALPIPPPPSPPPPYPTSTRVRRR